MHLIRPAKQLVSAFSLLGILACASAAVSISEQEEICGLVKRYVETWKEGNTRAIWGVLSADAKGGIPAPLARLLMRRFLRKIREHGYPSYEVISAEVESAGSDRAVVILKREFILGQTRLANRRAFFLVKEEGWRIARPIEGAPPGYWPEWWKEAPQEPRLAARVVSDYSRAWAEKEATKLYQMLTGQIRQSTSEEQLEARLRGQRQRPLMPVAQENLALKDETASSQVIFVFEEAGQRALGWVDFHLAKERPGWRIVSPLPGENCFHRAGNEG